MSLTGKNRFLVVLLIIFLAVSSYFSLKGQWYLSLFPVALLLIYFAIFNTEKVLISLGFFTPLSINIEEFGSKLGLFLPTEPILFGLMILLVWNQLKTPFLNQNIWKHPISIALGFYLLWLFITSITSTAPLVSFKFLLAKLWFVIPVFVFGTHIVQSAKTIRQFIWLLVSGMTIVMLYTLIHHASYGFGEEESHWVMSPFFKDHTIYGAIVALIVPLIIGLFFSKKHQPITQAILIAFFVINILALYFSYTRAAWLSVFAAFGIWMVLYFRIKLSWIALPVILLGLVITVSWDRIQMELERNKSEHTTEDFGERLQSATNVSSDASNLERINRWSCAIAMFREKPLVGFGPGTYAFEYARFQEPENMTIISTNFGDGGNAHSEYLGPLAETGLIGTISVMLLVIAIFSSSIQLYHTWPSTDQETRALILSMILALSTYFIHGILNNYLDTDKASVPIWFMCAAFVALKQRFIQQRV